MVSTDTGCCFARATTPRTSCAMEAEGSPATELPLREKVPGGRDLLLRRLAAAERADVGEADAGVVQDLRPHLCFGLVEAEAHDRVTDDLEERFVGLADRRSR